MISTDIEFFFVIKSITIHLHTDVLGSVFFISSVPQVSELNDCINPSVFIFYVAEVISICIVGWSWNR